MPTAAILACLTRVEAFFRRHDNPNADWISDLLARHAGDRDGFWKAVNSTRFWGGAGSIANEALGDNPGIPALEWQMEIRALREDLIEIAAEIQDHGDSHPDIQSWLLAFHNWNNAGQ